MRSPENQSLESRETGLRGSALFAIFNFGTVPPKLTHRHKPGEAPLVDSESTQMIATPTFHSRARGRWKIGSAT